MEGFLLDPHTHTSEISPCGCIDARRAVRMYAESGYGGIVITDHYHSPFFEKRSGLGHKNTIEQYLRGYYQALDEGEKLGLRVYLGMELRYDGSANDYLVYGFGPEFLYENPKLYALNPETFRPLIKGTGIRVFQAHPFRPGQVRADPRLLDGMEIYNGNLRHFSHNSVAAAYARYNGLTGIAGSDFHMEMDLACAGMLLASPPRDEAELSDALFSAGEQRIYKNPAIRAD